MNTVLQYLELTSCRFPKLTHSFFITRTEVNPYGVNLCRHRQRSTDSPRIQPASSYTQRRKVTHFHTPPINKVTTRTTSGIPPRKEVIISHAR
jgi:hypothetical protein